MKNVKVAEMRKYLNEALAYFNEFEPDAEIAVKETDSWLDDKSAVFIHGFVRQILAKEGIDLLPVIVVPIPVEMSKE